MIKDNNCINGVNGANGVNGVNQSLVNSHQSLVIGLILVTDDQ
jgi:hypothetical protein